MKGVRMLVGNFEFLWPNLFLTLKAIILNFDYMDRVNKMN